jgi:hypothetical protein
MAAGAAFLGGLVQDHSMGDIGDRLGRPLSMFRDSGQAAAEGYALFGLLAAMGVLQAIVMWRSRCIHGLFVSLVAVALLLLVAATPSLDKGHVLCSMLLMGLVYVYYAFILTTHKITLLLLHLFAPAIWLLVIHGHSYGLWQKGLILYFVAASNVHAVVSCLRGRHPPPRHKRLGRHGDFRRRRVYILGYEHAWARQ